MVAGVKRFIAAERGQAYTGGRMRRTASRFGRRSFLRGGLALTSLGLLAGCGIAPSVTHRPKVRRIGFLYSRSAGDPPIEGFRQGLRDLGYAEGRDIAIEFRFAEGQSERFPALAAELAEANVEVIVDRPADAARAAGQAAPSTPIVLAGGGGDPVGTGLIAGFARPGGNITGVSTASVDHVAKWLELLQGAVPGLSRVATLSDPRTPITAAHLREVERAAGTLRLHLQSLDLGEPDDLAPAFSVMEQGRAEGLVLLPGGRAGVQIPQIAGLAAAHGLPAIAEGREFAASGGLMAYGADEIALARRSAAFVDKVLKGTKPADLPMERPTVFEFVLNHRAARALGLTIPQSVLAQATEII